MDAREEVVAQIVILGSSAGGIDALGSVLERIGDRFAAPVLIAQHRDPARPSHLAEILGRRAAIPVHGVEAETEIKPGQAYVLPADHQMTVSQGRMEIGEDDGQRPTPSIDRILASAAAAYGEGVTAVILSGTGADGAAGARQVKAAGGTVVIQNPETAAYPAMPMSIATSLVDIIADADALGPLLEELVAKPRIAGRAEDEKRQLRAFLDDLRDRSGIDFGSYKRGTIMRRLQRRLLATGAADLRQYMAYLQQHPEEYQRLTSSFLIKVTEFFRDADLFDHLRDEVLPRLIEESRQRGRELRIWSAGCATGEEAYSLALLVADVLGAELPDFNVRIFATDVDGEAVAYARRGVYAAEALAAVPDALRNRHFTKVGQDYEVSKHIRGLTVFGQHDLGQRAPFPRIDLALCRNVLIYFTSDLQKRALQLFAFALRDGGYLALGKAESTSPMPEHFVLTHPRLKVYRRQGDRVLIPPARIRDASPLSNLRLPVARRPGWSEAVAAAREPSKAAELGDRAEHLLLRLPVGVTVVDRSYDVQFINSAARRAFGVHGQAIGDDLIHLLGDGVGAGVRAAIDSVFRGAPSEPAIVEVSSPTARGSESRYLEISVEAVPGDPDRSNAERAILVSVDVTSKILARREIEEAVRVAREEAQRAAEHARELADANAELLDANLELSTANAELRTANEDLLVANEEVQAATEEVETLNEELQATNEELETLNEELQATVEELNTTNDDLEARTLELQATALAAAGHRERAREDRSRMLAIADALEAPAIVVGSDGTIIEGNAAFNEALGDPESTELRLAEPDSPLSAKERSRAAHEPFQARVTAGRRRFRLVARPIEGEGDRSGLLILRSDNDGEGREGG